MSTFLYELPTTGSISFSDFCTDHTPSKRYTVAISNATQARANLRASLKETKRGERDYLKLVKIVDDYLPQLRGIMSCVAHDEISLKTEPIFTWRSTLSSTLFNTSPRLPIPSLNADYTSSLLTYAYALSNLSRSLHLALGAYETDPGISDGERRAKDEKLNFAVTLLCRASGVYEFVAGEALGEWEGGTHGGGEGAASARPIDLSREVIVALSKMALADAQTLAIRKLLSKSAYDSTLTPGPPLPKSHPSPSLLSKLHLECAELYASAKALAKSVSSSSSSSGSGGDAGGGGGGGGGKAEVTPDLRRYLTNSSKLNYALAYKWLGVDAGEAGGKRAGDAVAWLTWSKKELSDLKDGSSSSSIGGVGIPGGNHAREKELREKRKERVKVELDAVGVFLKHYKKINDSLSFEPIPSQTDLQSRIPAGVRAISAKPFSAPTPVFGPGSAAYVERKLEEMNLEQRQQEGQDEGLTPGSDATPRRGYANEGSYF